MNLEEASAEFARLSDLLDKGLADMRDCARDVAERENTYRQAKSEAWVRCPTGDGAKWTAARREAWVQSETADARQQRDIAEGLRQAAVEAVRSRRTQISALQTLLNAHLAEAKAAHYGPDA